MVMFYNNGKFTEVESTPTGVTLHLTTIQMRGNVLKKHHGLLITMPLVWFYLVTYSVRDPTIRPSVWVALKESGEVPNSLTQIRLILSPLALTFIVFGPHDVVMRWLALLAFGIVMLTDALDGYWARAWEQISDWGTVWDPAADKAIIVLTMAGLWWFGLIPAPYGTEAWFGLAYLLYTIVREVGLLLIRDKFVIKANWFGKWKTILLSIAFPLMLLPVTIAFPAITLWWNVFLICLLLGSFVCSFVSGVQYLIIYVKRRRETKNFALQQQS